MPLSDQNLTNIEDAAVVVEYINANGVHGAITVTNSASLAKVGGSVLADRKLLFLIPTDGTIYWGFTNTVSTSNGFPLFKNQPLILPVSDLVTIYLISAASVNVRCVEA